jgi:hypothetical protein
MNESDLLPGVASSEEDGLKRCQSGIELPVSSAEEGDKEKGVASRLRAKRGEEEGTSAMGLRGEEGWGYSCVVLPATIVYVLLCHRQLLVTTDWCGFVSSHTHTHTRVASKY